MWQKSLVLSTALGVCTACAFLSFPEPERQQGGAGTSPASGAGGDTRAIGGSGDSGSGGSPRTGSGGTLGGTSNAGSSGASGFTNEAGGAPGAGGSAGSVTACSETSDPAPTNTCEQNTPVGCGLLGPLAPACLKEPTQALNDPWLIDDFEDGDTCWPRSGARHGYWFGYGSNQDEGACFFNTLVFCDGARQSKVLGFNRDREKPHWWGIALWLQATSYCDEHGFDTGKTTGIEFWIRSDIARDLVIEARDGNTLRGGEEFGSTLHTKIHADTTWKQQSVRWSSFQRHIASMYREPLDPSSIVILKIAGNQEARYALYLDDVRFTAQ